MSVYLFIAMERWFGVYTEQKIPPFPFWAFSFFCQLGAFFFLPSATAFPFRSVSFFFLPDFFFFSAPPDRRIT